MIDEFKLEAFLITTAYLSEQLLDNHRKLRPYVSPEIFTEGETLLLCKRFIEDRLLTDVFDEETTWEMIDELGRLSNAYNALVLQ